MRWLSGTELVSASTDSTLKLWSVGGSTSGSGASGSGALAAAAAAGPGAALHAGGGGASSPELVRTFTGHANEKNFVGLSTDGEFIACGSETHEVHLYYKAIPRPSMSYSFGGGSGGGGGGPEAAAAAAGGLFVTAVAWRRSRPELLAANSAGHIWLLRLQP